MIRCHLSRLKGEHTMRITDVAGEAGLSIATVTMPYEEAAQKEDLQTIEKLRPLFECQVGGLFEVNKNKQG